MSAKQMMYDGLYETRVSAGESGRWLEQFLCDAVDGLCHTEKDVSIRHLIVKWNGEITQGSITLKLEYPATSSPPELVLDSNSTSPVIWDIPLGDVTTLGTDETSSAIRVRRTPSSDLSPDITSLEVQVMLDHNLSENWYDLVAVYSRKPVYRNSTDAAVVYPWGNYVSPDSAKVSSLLCRQIGGPISRGTIEVRLSVNGSFVKSVLLDSSTSVISSFGLLSDNISLSREDEVSIEVKGDKKLSPSGQIDLQIGLEIQHL